jgi:diguanylate cyclase (GGDEF)-like protein
MRRLLGAATLAVAVGITAAAAGMAAYVFLRVASDVAAFVTVATLFFLTFHLLIHIRALSRVGVLQRSADVRSRELGQRERELWLISALSERLGRESRAGKVIRASTEFFVEEVGATSVAYWPLATGEGDGGPSIAWPGDGSRVAIEIGDDRRAILAGEAMRRSRALIVTDADAAPLPLDIEVPPRGRFVLYVPVTSREGGWGVIEVHSDGASWDSGVWAIMRSLISQIGAALERGFSYDEMQQRAEIDYVTGLYNHRFIQERLQELIGAAAERGGTLAVMLLDVDNFKLFNDNLGHGVGDRVLQIVAGQLKLMADDVGTVGRFGGDEFIVVLPNHSHEEAEAFAQVFDDWLSNVAAPGTSEAMPISVSVGVAVYPHDAERRQELLASADARLYQTKKRSKGHRVGRRADAVSSGGLGVFGFLDRLVTAVDRRDNYTRVHCENAAEFAVMLAQEVGISPSAQRSLRLAALLHDVGKIGVPDGILGKAGRLSPDEFAVVKHHVNIAHQLIVDIPNAEEVRRLVLHHHERWDGSGYPDGLKGREIPYFARLLAVADAFSAITLERPYRHRLPLADGYDELQRVAGTQLDPQLVEAFGRVVRRLSNDRAREPTAIA